MDKLSIDGFSIITKVLPNGMTYDEWRPIMKEETKEYGLTECIKDLEALDDRTLGIYNASLLTAIMYGLLGEENAKEYINNRILKTLKEIKGITEE